MVIKFFDCKCMKTAIFSGWQGAKKGWQGGRFYSLVDEK
jgi:hypothetical protein